MPKSSGGAQGASERLSGPSLLQGCVAGRRAVWAGMCGERRPETAGAGPHLPEAVVVQGGSEGSNLELIKPGLSAYADSPRNATDSLIGLLDKAQNAVPKMLRASTPVRVGVTINYLLGKLGKYSDTVGVVDLGGGSVQMAYAISEEAAAKAPKPTDAEDTYVKENVSQSNKILSLRAQGLINMEAKLIKH